MAYNRRHFLERVIEIQKIVKEEKKQGKSQKWIFENLIEKQYHMCSSTFNNYMCINAKRELAKLEEKESLTVINQ
jgi:hypothetical protein